MSLCLRTELSSATEAFAIQQGSYSLLNNRSDLLTLAALNDGAKPLIENKESSKQVLMDNLMFAVIVFLVLVVILLCGKIFVIHKSLKDIAKTFCEKMTADTNTLIDVSCTDKYVCKLAADINTQLSILRSARIRYEQGDAELKTAITNISHDLRTPLTAICGYLEIMRKEQTSQKFSDYLDILCERADAMKQLTEELFRYSIVISDDVCPQTEEVIINEVLEECIIGYYAALSEKGIEPVIGITENRIVRQLNRANLLRVFSNLIGNALKYSDGDLHITLDDDGTVIFSNKASSLSGIDVGRLFDRFYTVESAGNSTGLGLSIARTLVERMNGTISAEYKSGKLKITVSLPKTSMIS